MFSHFLRMKIPERWFLAIFKLTLRNVYHLPFALYHTSVKDAHVANHWGTARRTFMLVHSWPGISLLKSFWNKNAEAKELSDLSWPHNSQHLNLDHIVLRALFSHCTRLWVVYCYHIQIHYILYVLFITHEQISEWLLPTIDTKLYLVEQFT